MEDKRITISDGVMTLKFGKEITIESLQGFKNSVEEKSNSPEIKTVIANLSETHFLDSSGIGFLVSLNSRLKRLDKNMYLLRPSEQICKTLELVRLISFFNLIDDELEIS
ncbi:STAS domain-containing protein [Desulfovibrio sp. UCD-KL4C]|uniref:STAS domain-containing protein n=1 Tax=Desulfovibrio sp. UCD-KL4C TaxID=2578120 RepID=UPI0025C30E9F|nr:STAS domain-containing protein [Desulfovibrio sp. UCD-KL4C]